LHIADFSFSDFLLHHKSPKSCSSLHTSITDLYSMILQEYALMVLFFKPLLQNSLGWRLM